MCPYLPHLLQNFVLSLVFGNGADKEATVVQTHTHSNELPGTDLEVVQHGDCSVGIISAPMDNTTNTGSVASTIKLHSTSGVDVTWSHDRGAIKQKQL